jgi:hypothetical protein
MRPNQSLLITALNIPLYTAVVMADDDAEKLGQAQFPVSCSSPIDSMASTARRERLNSQVIATKREHTTQA